MDELAKIDAKKWIDLEIPYSDLFSETRSSAAEQYRIYLDEEFRWKGLHYEQFFRFQANKPVQ